MDQFNLFDPRYQLEAEEDVPLSRGSLSREEIRHTILVLDTLVWRLEASELLRSGAGTPARAPGVEYRCSV